MVTDTTSQKKFNELRRRAEQLMTLKNEPDRAALKASLLELIHDLQVTQTELELQNEDLHRSQQALMKSQIKYTEIYDFAPIGYITMNKKGLILNANLTLSEMLQTHRAAIINQRFSNFVAVEDQDAYYRYLNNLGNSKIHKTCELHLKKKTAMFLTYNWKVSLFRTDLEAIGNVKDTEQPSLILPTASELRQHLNVPGFR